MHVCDVHVPVPSVSSSSANTALEGEDDVRRTSAPILRPASTLYSFLAFLIVRTRPWRLRNPASTTDQEKGDKDEDE